MDCLKVTSGEKQVEKDGMKLFQDQCDIIPRPVRGGGVTARNKSKQRFCRPRMIHWEHIANVEKHWHSWLSNGPKNKFLDKPSINIDTLPVFFGPQGSPRYNPHTHASILKWRLRRRLPASSILPDTCRSCHRPCWISSEWRTSHKWRRRLRILRLPCTGCKQCMLWRLVASSACCEGWLLAVHVVKAGC